MNTTIPMSKNSYGQILKSSSIMGGVAGVGLVLGMVRTKFAAVLIGTTGVGLAANFGVILGFVGTLAGLGIQSSAVRDVASAFAANDDHLLGTTILALRRICWLTGLLGAITMLLLSPWLSQLSFGSGEYQCDIAALGIILLLGNLQGGQMAVIQGTRRIADMARGYKSSVPCWVLLSPSAFTSGWVCVALCRLWYLCLPYNSLYPGAMQLGFMFPW